MKIKKLNTTATLFDIVDKINEIVELLNNSFLTQEANEAIVDMNNSLATISCDRLTPLTNEATSELTVDHLLNMIKGGQSIYDNIKCPKCGAKYFHVGPSCITAVNYPTIIKDGVSVNMDHNTSVTTYICECGHRWEQ